MIRFAYSQATVIDLASNVERTCAVTVDDGQLVLRPEGSDEMEVYYTTSIIPEGRRWTIVTADGHTFTIRRVGGCGCR